MEIVVAYLGCGTMGTTMLKRQLSEKNGSTDDSISISKVLACTSQESTAAKLRSNLVAFTDRIEVTSGANVEAVRKADAVILSCKPHMAYTILNEDGMAHAFAGKLVLSLLAGTSTKSLRDCFHVQTAQHREALKTTRFIRVMPTIGSIVGESMTLIETPTNYDGLAEDMKVVTALCAPLGPSYPMTESTFEPATALQAASIALSSILIDGLVDGAVAEGLKRRDAQALATQGLLSAAKLIASGEVANPADLREMVSSPRGVSIRAILAAEKAGLRYAGAAAVLSSAEHLRRMSARPT